MWPVWQPVSHSRRQNISAGFSVHHSLLQDMAATESSERIAVVRLYLGGVVPWKLISSRSDSTPFSHDEAWRGILKLPRKLWLMTVALLLAGCASAKEMSVLYRVEHIKGSSGLGWVLEPKRRHSHFLLSCRPPSLRAGGRS